LVYDDYDRGQNLIEGNYVFNNGDTGIQASAGTRIFNNIIVDPVTYGIHVQANQLETGKDVRNMYIAQNTIVSRLTNTGECLRIDSTTQGATFNISNNAIFCVNAQSFNLNAITGATITANGFNGGSALSSGSFAIGTVTTELLDPAHSNFYPKSNSSLISAGDANVLSVVTQDFNCLARSNKKPTVGAYEYLGATNSGWQLTGGFKTCTGSIAVTSSASHSTTSRSQSMTSGYIHSMTSSASHSTTSGSQSMTSSSVTYATSSQACLTTSCNSTQVSFATRSSVASAISIFLSLWYLIL